MLCRNASYDPHSYLRELLTNQLVVDSLRFEQGLWYLAAATLNHATNLLLVAATIALAAFRVREDNTPVLVGMARHV